MSFGHGSFCELPFSAIPDAVAVVVPEVPEVPTAPSVGTAVGPGVGFGRPSRDPRIEELRKRDVDVAVATLMHLRNVTEAYYG